MSDKTDLLLKTDDESTVSLNRNPKYINTKRKINGICIALCKETQDYRPEKTVENINAYLTFKDKMERILYSEISSFVFSLDMASRAVFATNVEKLLLYVLDDKNAVNDDCRKVVIKVYDHFQLALNQIENVNNIFARGIEETKINLKDEIKGVEKEYISILGIFASIVLTFVGGITFSSSVLRSMNGVSIYRLLITIDLLALILINVIYMLIKFVFIINEKQFQAINVKIPNVICIIFAVAVLGMWLLNAQSLPQFIGEILPWCT